MKRNHYSLFTAALMCLAVTSCSQEEDFRQSSNEMTTFNLLLESASQSRAAGEGVLIDKLYYEVFQDNIKVLDNYPTEAEKEANDYIDTGSVTQNANGSFKVELPLLKGAKYDIVFWAQNSEAGIYKPQELTGIEVDYYTNALANNEKYDAFFYGGKITASSKVTDIKLTRPFAQLNIGTTDQDWKNAMAVIGYKDLNPVTHSMLTASNLADKFNALAGEAFEPAEAKTATFAANKIYTGTFEAKETTYHYLSMNYLLVPGKVTTNDKNETVNASGTTNVTATFYRGAEATEETKAFSIDNLVNIPIQRNYRTNILGNLLADNKQFDVDMDTNFGGDENYPESDEEKLRLAAAVGGTVTLTGDLTLTEPLEIKYDMVLDLNGKTLTIAAKTGASVVTDINNYATLNIKNGKITAENNEFSRRCIYNREGGVMTIEEVEFIQTYDQKGAAINNEGLMTIENATVDAKYYAIWNSGEKAELIINDGTFISSNGAKGDDKNWCYAVNNSAKAKMIVNDGTFKGNHGTIASTSGAQAILKKGEYTCTGVYSEGVSDWVLYANDALISYYYENCTLKNEKIESNTTCVAANGIINQVKELKGQTITETVKVEENTTIILDEITINPTTGSAIEIADNLNVVIYVLNNVNLNATSGDAISIPKNSTVTIKGIEDVVGALSSRSVPQAGNLSVVSEAGSGIGCAGTLTIENIKKLTAKGNGDKAFGIGGNTANVTIINSYIDYVCGGHVQPLFISDTSYGKSEPEGGAAIGGASIKLDGVTIKKADGGSKAAGIGAQYWQSTKIEILNTTIEEVNGGNASAGIGGSRYSSDISETNKQSIQILIENSTVTANGGQFGAGIGAGYDTHCKANNTNAVNDITIKTSTINAKGGQYGAGIGTGYHSAALTGSIDAASIINATPGESREKYTIAQAIGYGVVDVTREFKDAVISFTVAGETIDNPLEKATISSSANLVHIQNGGTFDISQDINVSAEDNLHTQTATEDITINGNGNTFVSTAESVDDFQWEGGTIPAMSTILSSADGSKVTVNNLNFSGTMSALMLGHYQNSTYNNYNTELNNVNVVNTKVVSFSSNVSPAVCIYGTAVLNNCNVYGTTLSELDTDPMWPVYDVAAVNYSTTTINGGKIGSFLFWNQAALIVNDKSVIEKLVILGNMNNNNKNNYIKINSGAEIKEIDLSNVTDKNRVKITIDAGATVGKIIANGVEYATIEDYKK